MKKRHSIKSRMNMEAYAHILEDAVFRDNKDPLEALGLYARELRGVYAIASLIAGREMLYALQMGQPLVIGLTSDNECVYLASSIPCLHGFADEASILEEGIAISTAHGLVSPSLRDQAVQLLQVLEGKQSYVVLPGTADLDCNCRRVYITMGRLIM